MRHSEHSVHLFGAYRGRGLSPLLIKMLPRGNPDTKSFLIVAASLALSFVFVLNPFFSSATSGIPVPFQFLLFFAFVSVSRMRRRKSQFLHALMSIPSRLTVVHHHVDSLRRVSREPIREGRFGRDVVLGNSGASCCCYRRRACRKDGRSAVDAVG